MSLKKTIFIITSLLLTIIVFKFNIVKAEKISPFFNDVLNYFKTNSILSQNNKTNITYPIIVYVYPSSRGAQDDNVYIDFSKNIDQNTINEKNIYIKSNTGKKIKGKLNYIIGKNRIIFVPQNNFKLQSSYIVYIKGGDRGIKDMNGNNLEKDFSWSFIIDKVTKTPPPIAIADSQDYYINKPKKIILDASHSYDPQRRQLKYFWKQVAGTTVNLKNKHNIQAEFFAPLGLSEMLTFELVVDNGLQLSKKSFVDIVINTEKEKNNKIDLIKKISKKLLGYELNKEYIDQIINQDDIIYAIVSSDDYSQKIIQYWFEIFLNRKPNLLENIMWEKQLRNNITYEEAILQFISSNEYNNKYKDDMSFIQSLYKNLLNRGADQNGLKYWVNLLSKGEKRTNIAKNFIYSQEFLYSYIKKIYNNIIHTAITEEKLNNYYDTYKNTQNRLRPILIKTLKENI